MTEFFCVKFVHFCKNNFIQNSPLCTNLGGELKTTKKIIKSKIPKICFFLHKQKSKNMCSFEIDQLRESICFVFDCVTHEDKYSCPEFYICLSHYATWND